ncbi:T9SS type A sorting domain-containing protein [Tenacibaculum maritimum]|uniref:InlB B-repeat-containing protein n=1 Tax=Tenacibaculum maritimum TaxID=107401 RepID=UPI0012E4097A|nr:T9SS type A sorting domain-containing protein [Tenacibaculum maritimum]CAA0243399.1 Protein of unknown function precursor containing a C-terminal secretion signal [Tenacibaculum maritimum]
MKKHVLILLCFLPFLNGFARTNCNEEQKITSFRNASFKTFSALHKSVNINNNSQIQNPKTNELLINNKQTEITASSFKKAQQYNLTIDTNNGGSITMKVNGAVLAPYPYPTNAVFDENTEVTLNASPSNGYEFVEWIGDVTGNTSSLKITMDSDKKVTAVFKKAQQHTLTADVSNGGSLIIEVGNVVTNPYPYPTKVVFDHNTEITLNANPNNGYEFVEWTGDVTGNTNPLKITLDSDKNITAVFKKTANVLTLNASNGVIAVTANNLTQTPTKYPISGNFPPNTMVSLNAKPSNGYKFVKWTGDITVNTPITTIKMDGDKNVTAVFEKDATPVVYIPDANFKEILIGKQLINTNNDNEIQVAEAEAYSGEIYVSGEGKSESKKIKDLTGIEAFKNLVELDCSYNRISYLVLSNNPKLKIVNANNNQIFYASLFSCTELKELKIETNLVPNLDLSENTKLEVLHCSNNSLQELSAPNSPIFNILTCSNNQLTTLDTSNNPNLNSLKCNGNLLSKLDISNNTNLETLNCANNNLSNLNINIGHLLNNFDATNNPNLTCIEVDDINAIPAPWYKDAIAQYSTNCNATAGVDDIFTSKLSIYPNPVNDLLRITKNQHQDIKNVHIFNMVGQKILQTDELTINCSELSKGVYILKVESTDHKTGIKKFIKN